MEHMAVLVLALTCALPPCGGAETKCPPLAWINCYFRLLVESSAVHPYRTHQHAWLFSPKAR